MWETKHLWNFDRMAFGKQPTELAGKHDNDRNPVLAECDLVLHYHRASHRTEYLQHSNALLWSAHFTFC